MMCVCQHCCKYNNTNRPIILEKFNRASVILLCFLAEWKWIKQENRELCCRQMMITVSVSTLICFWMHASELEVALLLCFACCAVLGPSQVLHMFIDRYTSYTMKLKQQTHWTLYVHADKQAHRAVQYKWMFVTTCAFCHYLTSNPHWVCTQHTSNLK